MSEYRWKSTLSPHLPAMSYREQLQYSEWNKKRAEIWQRDGHKCVRCGSRTMLHVHHKEYKSGIFAWEYPNSELETLCNDCHSKEHKPESPKTQGLSIEDKVDVESLARDFKAFPEGMERYFQDARQYQQYTLLRELGEYMERKYFEAKHLIESGQV